MNKNYLAHYVGLLFVTILISCNGDRRPIERAIPDTCPSEYFGKWEVVVDEVINDNRQVFENHIRNRAIKEGVNIPDSVIYSTVSAMNKDGFKDIVSLELFDKNIAYWIMNGGKVKVKTTWKRENGRVIVKNNNEEIYMKEFMKMLFMDFDYSGSVIKLKLKNTSKNPSY